MVISRIFETFYSKENDQNWLMWQVFQTIQIFGDMTLQQHTFHIWELLSLYLFFYLLKIIMYFKHKSITIYSEVKSLRRNCKNKSDIFCYICGTYTTAPCICFCTPAWKSYLWLHVQYTNAAINIFDIYGIPMNMAF